eukprot:s226_g15.t1
MVGTLLQLRPFQHLKSFVNRDKSRQVKRFRLAGQECWLLKLDTLAEHLCSRSYPSMFMVSPEAGNILFDALAPCQLPDNIGLSFSRSRDLHLS